MVVATVEGGIAVMIGLTGTEMAMVAATAMAMAKEVMEVVM